MSHVPGERDLQGRLPLSHLQGAGRDLAGYARDIQILSLTFAPGANHRRDAFAPGIFAGTSFRLWSSVTFGVPDLCYLPGQKSACEVHVRNWANWMFVIGGMVCIIAELLMGAATGFDLALIGGSLVVGGGIGLWFESTKVGLLSAGVLSLVYLLFFRRLLRHKLTPKEQPTNVDAIMGLKGLVTVRIAPHAPGQVKVADEIWRAELASDGDDSTREPGQEVTVAGIEGVTLKVR